MLYKNILSNKKQYKFQKKKYLVLILSQQHQTFENFQTINYLYFLTILIVRNGKGIAGNLDLITKIKFIQISILPQFMSLQKRFKSYHQNQHSNVDEVPNHLYHQHHQYSFSDGDPNINPEKSFKIEQEVRQVSDSQLKSKIKPQSDNYQSHVYLSPYSGQGIGSRIQQRYINSQSRSKGIILTTSNDQLLSNRIISIKKQDPSRRINMSFEYPEYQCKDPEKYRKVNIKVNITPFHTQEQDFSRQVSKINPMNQYQLSHLHSTTRIQTHQEKKQNIQKQIQPSKEFSIKSRGSTYFQNNDNNYQERIKKKCEIEDIIGNDNIFIHEGCMKNQKQPREYKCLLLRSKDKQQSNKNKSNFSHFKLSNSYYEQFIHKKAKSKNKSSQEEKLPKSNSFLFNLNYQTAVKLQKQRQKAHIQKNSQEKQTYTSQRDAKVKYPPSSPYYHEKILSKDKEISSRKINEYQNFKARRVNTQFHMQLHESLEKQKDVNKSGQYTFSANNYSNQLQRRDQEKLLIKQHFPEQQKSSFRFHKNVHDTLNQKQVSKFNDKVHLKHSLPSKTQFKQHLMKHFMVRRYLNDPDIEKLYQQVCHMNTPEQQWIIVALNEIYKKQLQNPQQL